MKLILTENTPFKSWPWDSKTLTYKEMPIDWMEEGEHEIQDYFMWDGIESSKNDDHIAFLLSDGITRYVWAQHCRIEGTEEGNDPIDDPPRIEKKRIPIFDRGKMLDIPGIGRAGTKDKIIKGGHFTWGEATKGTRIPVSPQISYQIVEFAKYMELVRDRLWDQPLYITSWYRPPAVNRAVGGASRSKHLQGYAVDFYVKGKTPAQVFERLKDWHVNGGLAPGRKFVHIDRSGPKAPPRRWYYPGGPKITLW